ncbi:MAG: nicotinate-nucleotide--dimethylbenzimidazole phosphoribosyltransferase [Oscillospiraceae bacterium]|nr:nicotinate-nucleotide--dimethylbenzimidazole phosphoribosyltransferase [Oscillospiraceae bacterium]
MDFNKINNDIKGENVIAKAAAKAHWDGIAKPLDGLGMLEKYIIKIAALIGTEDVRLDKKAVLVLCADNGVICEGVTQTDASVTAIQAKNISLRKTSVCLMSTVVGADPIPVDMGMLNPVEGVRDCRCGNGTDNLAVGPAMTYEQAEKAIEHGIKLVGELKEQGYRIIATGEMGIGNTTTSSACTATLLSLPVEEVTGRGAGLSDERLTKKINAIKRGIEVNRPDCTNPLDVLAKLGGFDIAGMVGVYLGGALYGVPIIIDGLISSVAALIAARLCPKASCCMIASHCSAEPAAKAILAELGVEAIISAGLKLGEGTGAVCMMPILDMALKVYHGSVGFNETGIDQYTVQDGDKR